MSRIINMYYNVITDELLDGDTGYTLRPGRYPWVFFRENPIINLRLVEDGDLTAHQVFTGATYRASVDDDFSTAGELMCMTEDTGINVAGDWLEDPDNPATADPTAGQFSIRLDANTLGFSNKISTADESLDSEFELMSFDGSSNITGVLRMPLIARNLVNSGVIESIASVAPLVSEETIDGQKTLVLRNSDGVVVAQFGPA